MDDDMRKGMATGYFLSNIQLVFSFLSYLRRGYCLKNSELVPSVVWDRAEMVSAFIFNRVHFSSI